jgi:hypothetical protein
MLYRAYSGYVHGAYVHIMELHRESRPHDMRGTAAHLAVAIGYSPNRQTSYFKQSWPSSF